MSATQRRGIPVPQGRGGVPPDGRFNAEGYGQGGRGSPMRQDFGGLPRDSPSRPEFRDPQGGQQRRPYPPGQIPMQGSTTGIPRIVNQGMSLGRRPGPPQQQQMRGPPPQQRQRQMNPLNQQPPNRKPHQPTSGLPSLAGKGRSDIVGAAISKPSPVSQWPLMEPSNSRPPPIRESGIGQGEAPRRPQRPLTRDVPSFLSTSPQESTPPPNFAYRAAPVVRPQAQYSDAAGPLPPFAPQQPYDNQMLSPISPNMSSHTNSSSGVSITDFPPIPSMSNRRIPPMPTSIPPMPVGPPSARKGNSAYYSQASFVSPIPEESTHGSLASSAAIPSRSSWMNNQVDYSGKGYESSTYDDDFVNDDPKLSPGLSDTGDDSQGLVRQGSIGRRQGRPNLVTVKRKSSDRKSGTFYNDNSSDSVNTLSKTTTKSSEKSGNSMVTKGALAAGATGALVGALMGGGKRNITSPVGDPEAQGGAVLLDASPNSSGPNSPHELSPRGLDLKKVGTNNSLAPQTPKDSQNTGGSQFLGIPGLGVGGQRGSRTSSILGADGQPMPKPVGFSSRLSGALRRPPRLNIDAVREAEVRGSLTSLPDLIRRATRLASALDRGARPASNLRWDQELPSDYPYSPNEALTGSSPSGRRSAGSISDILASFPPPVLAQPPGSRDQNRTTRQSRRTSLWPVAGGMTRGLDDDSRSFPEDEKAPAHGIRRRVCGLPLWAVILLGILAVLLIAAAVIIPLQLVNLSRKNNASTAAPADQSGMAQCQASLKCANGGQNVFSANICRCVCVNGFTGSTCSQTDTACTTTNIASSNSSDTTDNFKNATLGTAIPRLLLTAKGNFSIPLDSSKVFGAFSKSNLSCTSENSLVTFDGRDSRIPQNSAASSSVSSGSAASSATSTGAASAGTTLAGAMPMERRDATITESAIPSSTAAASGLPSQAAYTSNGIVLASSVVSVGASAPSASASSSSTTSISLDENALDFARCSVLFIAQQTDLNTALIAQENLQAFFTAGRDFGQLNVVGNVIMDFDTLKLTVGNQTFGGKYNRVSS
jgi:hypothetical protein